MKVCMMCACGDDGLMTGMRHCTVAGLRWFPQMDLRAVQCGVCSEPRRASEDEPRTLISGGVCRLCMRLCMRSPTSSKNYATGLPGQPNLEGQSDTIVTHLRNIVLPRRFTRLCMFSLTVRVVLVRLANKNVTTKTSRSRDSTTPAR